jgi:type III secretion protein L
MDDGHRDERRPGTSGARVIGKVIKGDHSSDAPERARPARPGVLNAEEFEARTVAQKIIDDAKRAAAELIEAAHRQKAEIFDQARAEAREEVIRESTTELARAKLQAGQILKACEQDAVNLACLVAEKIIGRDLQRDPSLVLEICATAIESVRSAKSMVLRVNPRDGAQLREKRPTLIEMIGRTVDLAIRDDSDVEPGGCIIQTEFGTVDAQLKTQFEMLKNVLVPDASRRDGPR